MEKKQNQHPNQHQGSNSGSNFGADPIEWDKRRKSHQPMGKIMGELRGLEKKIGEEMDELERLLGYN